MSEIRHTAGPWEVDMSGYRAPGGGLCVMAGDLCVAVVAGDSDKPQAENADVIAAAPELLEALKSLMFHDGDGWNADGWFSDEQLQSARAAIAKATGSQS